MSVEPGEAPEGVDDLREQLPEQLRTAHDGDIPALWLAWSAARHGHAHAYLVSNFNVTSEIAETLVALSIEASD